MTWILFLEICFIGFGLAMDSFAVSVTSGVIMKQMHLRHALRIACFFGFFQAMMPIIGWAGGLIFKDAIQNFDHWIAFILLFLLGGKMIYEATNRTEDDEPFNPMSVYVLFTLAIATSIDALAVGITFSLLDTPVWTASGLIGLITFVISLIGTQVGRIFGHVLENKMEIVGGLVLISIGLKILIEHLFFA
ncbi:MAG: manganese efflux pump MntP family protein [Lentisphaeria bacterium]